jgi:hypothetical protein
MLSSGMESGLTESQDRLGELLANEIGLISRRPKGGRPAVERFPSPRTSSPLATPRHRTATKQKRAARGHRRHG